VLFFCDGDIVFFSAALTTEPGFNQLRSLPHCYAVICYNVFVKDSSLLTTAVHWFE